MILSDGLEIVPKLMHDENQCEVIVIKVSEWNSIKLNFDVINNIKSGLRLENRDIKSENEKLRAENEALKKERDALQAKIYGGVRVEVARERSAGAFHIAKYPDSFNATLLIDKQGAE